MSRAGDARVPEPPPPPPRPLLQPDGMRRSWEGAFTKTGAGVVVAAVGLALLGEAVPDSGEDSAAGTT